jgi:hypothetical protein
VPSTASIPYWHLSQTQSLTFKSLHSGTAMGTLPKMVSPSNLDQWRTPFVRAIGQTMASLGATDCRLIAPKTLDYRLSQQLAGWRRADPAPQRVTPASLRLIDYAHALAVLHPSPLHHAVVDMAYIAFFFLNHPGE